MFEPGDGGRTTVGRVTGKGLADELHDRGYLVIDGVDGKAHYVALNARDGLANYPTGAAVEVRGSVEVRVADGLWKVPDDLAERGRQYDAQRLGGMVMELKSHLPIERQARVIGTIWLDQQLISGGRGLGDPGFGSDTKQAMQQRANFLEKQGLAQRREQQVILTPNLLGTLRNRELAQAAKDIATETGLEYRPMADGQRVASVYRHSVMLASGRNAMLDDGMGFSLVPWQPVIEQRLGHQIAATMRGGGVSWEIGRQHGIGIAWLII